ncbi:hypothetical protein BDF19DRAFT_202821 [Syncephalis fuscata]|nr:hypothetical protein BDF19DRAFT_202821 [Syncephalis fuscata]
MHSWEDDDSNSNITINTMNTFTNNINEHDTSYYIYDYHLSIAQTSLFHIHLHLLGAIALFNLFLYNLRCAFAIVSKQPYKVSSWCCIITASAGMVFSSGFLLPYYLFGTPSCLTLYRAMLLLLMVSTIATHSILLERAYLAYSHSRIMLCWGILMLLPTFLFVYMAWLYSSTLVVQIGPLLTCSFTTSLYIPYLRSLIDIPGNVIFSSAFLHVAYQQYCRSGTKTWQTIAYDGTFTMTLVILSHLFCVFGHVFSLLGDANLLLYAIDW